MMGINEVSQSIVNRLNKSKEQEVFVDPVTLTLIASIVTQIVKLLIKYIEYKEEEKEKSPIEHKEEIAYRIIKQPSFWQRWTLKQMIRKEMGVFKYWWNGKEIYNAVLDEGKDTDIYTIKNLLRNN